MTYEEYDKYYNHRAVHYGKVEGYCINYIEIDSDEPRSKFHEHMWRRSISEILEQ